MEQKEQPQQEFKHLVRIVNTDLDGNKQVMFALRKIKGVSYMIANAACTLAHVEKHTKTGYLTDDETKRLNDVITNPSKFNIPTWMMNRRNDYETGQTSHLLTGDITYAQGNDVKRLKMIKARRGIRHALGLPVRGQRTKSNFRRNKGKVLGVKRKSGAKEGRV